LFPISRLVAATLFASAVCGCWQGSTREVSSTVLVVDGQASLDRGSGGKVVPLAFDSHPGRGDIIETQAEGRASLSLLPNVLVQLERGARMKIIRLETTKDGNETGADIQARVAEIELNKGRILVSHSWGEALARFRLVTPQGEATTPSNALFIVQAEQQKTRITCASGWLEFRPTGADNGTRVPPGSTGEWPSAGSNITPAETDPVAQEDLQQAIEVEQLLRKLAAQKRNSLPR
jgi:hypothetical protein